MNAKSHQLSSHAVGTMLPEGRVPLQPVSSKLYSSTQRGTAAKSSVKLVSPKK
jgi:hypothetical protein